VPEYQSSSVRVSAAIDASDANANIPNHRRRTETTVAEQSIGFASSYLTCREAGVAFVTVAALSLSRIIEPAEAGVWSILASPYGIDRTSSMRRGSA
jgi:hypothetical protein